MTRTTALAVLLALLVLLSGCSFLGPGGQSTPARSDGATNTTEQASTGEATATPTPEGQLVLHYDPSYDASLVLERVEEIRGVESNETIHVFTYEADDGESWDLPDRFAGIGPPAARALQLYSTREARTALANGYFDTESGELHVHVMAEDDLAERGLSQEVVLAHELAHALQSQQGFRRAERPVTTDAALENIMVVEGEASFVDQRYSDRYASGGAYIERRNDSANRKAWRLELRSIAYYEGYRSTAAADGWGERTERIRQPRPTTTAELLHPDDGVDYPGRPVPAPPLENVSAADRDRVGELTVRFALRTNGVPYADAAAAAEGWRNDTLLSYYALDAVYWGTRWANASEAAAFEAAWVAMLERRNASRDGSLLVVPGDGRPYPTVYYAIDRSGEVVQIAAGESAADVRTIAAAWNRSAASTEPRARNGPTSEAKTGSTGAAPASAG